jgi:hypothetical protein
VCHIAVDAALLPKPFGEHRGLVSNNRYVARRNVHILTASCDYACVEHNRVCEAYKETAETGQIATNASLIFSFLMFAIANIFNLGVNYCKKPRIRASYIQEVKEWPILKSFMKNTFGMSFST